MADGPGHESQEPVGDDGEEVGPAYLHAGGIIPSNLGQARISVNSDFTGSCNCH